MSSAKPLSKGQATIFILLKQLTLFFLLVVSAKHLILIVSIKVSHKVTQGSDILISISESSYEDHVKHSPKN
jgi:hypothetical protein